MGDTFKGFTHNGFADGLRCAQYRTDMNDDEINLRNVKANFIFDSGTHSFVIETIEWTKSLNDGAINGYISISIFDVSPAEKQILDNLSESQERFGVEVKPLPPIESPIICELLGLRIFKTRVRVDQSPDPYLPNIFKEVFYFTNDIKKEEIDIRDVILTNLGLPKPP